MTTLLIANETEDGRGYVFKSDVIDQSAAMTLGKLTWAGLHGVDHDVTREEIEELNRQLRGYVSGKKVDGQIGTPCLLLAAILDGDPVDTAAVSDLVHDAARPLDDRLAELPKQRGKGSVQGAVGRVHRKAAGPPRKNNEVKPW